MTTLSGLNGGRSFGPLLCKKQPFLEYEYQAPKRNLRMFKTRTIGASALAISLALGGTAYTSSNLKAADINEYVGVDWVSEVIVGAYEDDTTLDSNENNPEIRTLGELHIDGKFKTDSGLTIGGEIEFEAGSDVTNNIDEIYIYASGEFGRIEAGDQDGAADKLGSGVPSVGFGQVGGDWNTDDDGFAGQNPITEIAESSDDTKITYYAPSIGGIKFGISWAPLDDDGSTAEITAGEETDQFEVGAQYSSSFANGKVTLAAAYFTANDNDAGDRDHSNWDAGITLEFDAFEVGVNHVNLGDSGRGVGEDVTGTTLGMTYGVGNWGFGASYNTSEFDAPASQDQDVWSVGTEYVYEPQINGETPVTVTLAGDFTMFDRSTSNNGATLGDDGWVAIVYSALEF
jgi:hypothetical protein